MDRGLPCEPWRLGSGALGPEDENEAEHEAEHEAVSHRQMPNPGYAFRFFLKKSTVRCQARVAAALS